jgi:D-amino-acid dehydrogenase
MRQSRSVIICGGGVIGLSCAYYLAREGWRVTVVERNAEGADTCAHGSAGFVSPSHVIPLAAPGMVWKGLKWMMSSRSPFYIKPRLDGDLMRWGWLFARACNERHVRRSAPVLRDLCLESRKMFVDWADITGNAFALKTEGLLNLCQTQEGLDHETHGLAALANELGIEAQVLDAAQTAALEPGARLAVVGSVYFPIDAHITPRRLMAALPALLKDMGVKFSWNTGIYGWRAEGGRIAGVSTTAGDLFADEYVLAGGSWSPAMVAGLGLRLPMQAGKGYSLTIEKPRFQLSKALILTERRVAVTPMGETLRFGGTMEISGHSDNVRPERIEQIIAAARAFFPEITAADFAGLKPWFGYRPVTPDGMPYLGRLGRYANLATASGHAMLGLTLAPVSGLLIAELLSGRKPSVDLTLLNPNRFA